MNEIEEILEKLYSYYNVSTITELAKKINMSQPAVTNWQRRNAVSAIKKKCRELGIYNEIFGDLSSINITQGNNGRAGGRDYIENSKEGNRNSLIPESILIELNSLFERIKNKDDRFIKSIVYKIEDYIDEVKKELRE
ncbi:MAG: helix-turn-helix domain-containing protein [Arcobacteraceae bacterium]|nr:helix-turn-helix domain-containing protein [Arcobacteraceae bacterium]